MEGEDCSLRCTIKTCKQYSAYIYVDEAHSIGAMGPTGRGICEYTGVDPSDIDILEWGVHKKFRCNGRIHRELKGCHYHVTRKLRSERIP